MSRITQEDLKTLIETEAYTIKDMYERNFTIAKIGEKIHCPSSTTCKIVSKLICDGFMQKRQKLQRFKSSGSERYIYREPNQSIKRRIKRMIDHGWTLQEICKDMKEPINKLWYYLNLKLDN